MTEEESLMQMMEQNAADEAAYAKHLEQEYAREMEREYAAHCEAQAACDSARDSFAGEQTPPNPTPPPRHGSENAGDAPDASPTGAAAFKVLKRDVSAAAGSNVTDGRELRADGGADAEGAGRSGDSKSGGAR